MPSSSRTDELVENLARQVWAEGMQDLAHLRRHKRTLQAIVEAADGEQPAEIDYNNRLWVLTYRGEDPGKELRIEFPRLGGEPKLFSKHPLLEDLGPLQPTPSNIWLAFLAVFGKPTAATNAKSDPPVTRPWPSSMREQVRAHRKSLARRKR